MNTYNITQHYRSVGSLLIAGMLLVSPVGPAFAEEVSTSTDPTTPSVDLLIQEQHVASSTSGSVATIFIDEAETSYSQTSFDSQNDATSTGATSSTTLNVLNSILPQSTDCGSTSSKVITISTQTHAGTSLSTTTENSTSTEGVSSKSDCITSATANQTLNSSNTQSGIEFSSTTSSVDIDTLIQSHDGATTTIAMSGPIILSGKAVAEANILNIANADIVNSSGSVVFANLTDHKKGIVDLRGESSMSSSTCSIASCLGNSDIEMNVALDGHIANYIQLSADSGDNSIVGEGNTIIQTGDAFAALNLVNIANINLIGSEYLIVALNAFKGVDGDIIFPNLDKFFNTESRSVSSLSLTNTGAIINDVALNADSGHNDITAASSSVHAGDAHATSNIYNQLNSTLGANDMVSMLFNVHGAWNGKLVNAPFGLMNSRTADGSYFLSSPSYSSSLPRDELASESLADRSLGIVGTSTAWIENNIDIDARSGNNSIFSSGSGLINSGKAYAGANIINIANASVIGKNWLLAIVNIFGDFNGDITFGRPNLWVGDRAETPPPFMNGNELTYRFTVINKGDAPSSNVTLSGTLDTAHLDIVRSSLPYRLNKSNELVWELGDLPQGKAIELTLTARIKNDVAEGTSIENRVGVHGTEAESITDNNSDVNVIKTYVTQAGGSSSGGGNTIIVITPNSAPVLTSTSVRSATATSSQTAVAATSSLTLPIDIMRSTATTTIDDIGAKSSQSIVIKNPNNEKITSVIFHDILLSPSGAVIKNEEWDLGTLLPHEEVTIGYDIAFNRNATSGVYFLSSTVSRPNMKDSVYGMNGAIVLMRHEAVQTKAQSRNTSKLSVMEVQPQASSIVSAVASAASEILAETAYAANANDILIPDHNWSRLAFIVLFFMPMLVTILFISIRKHKLIKSK